MLRTLDLDPLQSQGFWGRRQFQNLSLKKETFLTPSSLRLLSHLKRALIQTHGENAAAGKSE